MKADLRTEHARAIGSMDRSQREATDRLVRAAFRAARLGGTVEAQLEAIFELGGDVARSEAEPA